MKAYKRTLAKWVTEKSEELGERFLDLVRGCNTDLYYNGPLTAEDAEAEGIENWPGFEKACDEIRSMLELGDIYIDVNCETWSDVEPEDSEPGWVYRVDRSEQVIALVGVELAPYVR